MKRTSVFLFITLALASSASAQTQTATTLIGEPQPVVIDPPIAPDPGSIENSPASNSTAFVNCWIVRKKTTAIAIRVFNKQTSADGDKYSAKLRQYSSEDDAYIGVKTEIKEGAISLIDEKVIDLLIVPAGNADYPDLYKMQFDKDKTANEDYITIGYINFIRGNHSRVSSKAAIKILKTSSGVTVTPASDPCDEPPVDDIGEEEVIARSTSDNQNEAPTSAVSRIVKPSPSVQPIP